MDEDPTFYKQFSELLEETIRAYREKRLSERDYLNRVVDLASKVARKDRGRDVPERIRGDEDAQAFFGILDGELQTKGEEPVAGNEAAFIALEIIGIIKSHLIVDIWSNEVAQNNLTYAIVQAVQFPRHAANRARARSMIFSSRSSSTSTGRSTPLSSRRTSKK